MQFMYRKIFVVILALFIVFYGCDIIEEPYTETTNSCGHDNLSIPIKKVLVEDYTGFKCGNCPEAHEKLQNLITSYCDHIIPVSIHVGYFATPSSTPPYTTDFRTPAGDEYNTFFGADAAGLPIGMVNRTQYNGSVLITPDAWADAVSKQLESAPVIDLQVENEYDTSTRNVNSDVTVSFLENFSGDLYLSLWLVEDSIIDYQKDYNSDPVDIPDYVHRFVLRGAINGTWGEQIFSGEASQNKQLNFSFSYALDTAYNYKNCYVVAFVYKPETKEVLQAEKEKIAE